MTEQQASMVISALRAIAWALIAAVYAHYPKTPHPSSPFGRAIRAASDELLS